MRQHRSLWFDKLTNHRSDYTRCPLRLREVERASEGGDDPGGGGIDVAEDAAGSDGAAAVEVRG